MAIGRVCLVGAGPGDPELLTVKGRERLMEADVILFDRLLDGRMLEGLNAELIDVGKNAGRHKLRQEEINQLLVEKAEEGKIVVRLKGGDPYLFGRGGRRQSPAGNGEYRLRLSPESPRPSPLPVWRGFQ